MAKNFTCSLVLVLVVMAILNGHVEAAGRGAEMEKDGSNKSQKTFIDCARWNYECFVLHDPIACSLFYQFCVYNKGTNTQAAGPNPQTFAKSSSTRWLGLSFYNII
jgi:hypothetical protein